MVAECRAASENWVRLVQKEFFRMESELLVCNRRTDNHVCSDSSLRKLSIVLINDVRGVGGRLQWFWWSDTEKHPMILPSRYAITDMITQYYHELEGHAGSTQVLAAVRKKVWVMRGGTAVRCVVGKCIHCRRFPSLPCRHAMAPLPSVRVESTGFSFESVRVDVCGSMSVKRGRVEEKRYGRLFTCLNLRAVHIEINHTSTDSVPQALARFMARMGQPKVIYSDNESNFHGVQSEIKYCLRNWSQENICTFLLAREIQWIFMPPEASH